MTAFDSRVQRPSKFHRTFSSNTFTFVVLRAYTPLNIYIRTKCAKK